MSSFGVSITTMEEVFMKVGEGTEKALNTEYVAYNFQSVVFYTLYKKSMK